MRECLQKSSSAESPFVFQYKNAVIITSIKIKKYSEEKEGVLQH